MLLRRLLMVWVVMLAAALFVAPARADTASEAAQAWSAAKDTTSTAVLEEFIRRYSETFYAALARARLEELQQAKKPAQADQSSPSSEEAAGDKALPPKMPDRLNQSSSTEQVAPEQQGAVLYAENPSNSKGDRYVGWVVWHSEPNWASGKKMEVVVRGDIEIPDRKLKATLSFRRNTDPSLPASHTIELAVKSQDTTDPHIANVPGMLTKTDEKSRGIPLASVAVKVAQDFFMIGLSNVDAKREHNILLLKQRSWFDIPVVYTNGRRAIIAVEKGPTGTKIFNDAFAAWER